MTLSDALLLHLLLLLRAGPYTVAQMAVQPWAHNAFLAQDPPTKEWVLFHIGTDAGYLSLDAGLFSH